MRRGMDFFQRQRREFLTTTASGLGGMALGSMLTDDGVLRAQDAVFFIASQTSTKVLNGSMAKLLRKAEMKRK